MQWIIEKFPVNIKGYSASLDGIQLRVFVKKPKINVQLHVGSLNIPLIIELSRKVMHQLIGLLINFNILKYFFSSDLWLTELYPPTRLQNWEK
jgi:hypothetical protein